MRPAGALRGLETREALLLAFFATFVVLARAALRWHLHVPGHSLFATAFFLVLARACVDRRAAASTAGLLAGLACAALGMGKGGPLVALKLLLPGIAIDAGAALGRVRLDRVPAAALLGAAAGASDFFPTAAVELLAGAPVGVVAWHALLGAGAKAAFGALGGVAAAAVVRRLHEHGILPEPG